MALLENTIFEHRITYKETRHGRFVLTTTSFVFIDDAKPEKEKHMSCLLVKLLEVGRENDNVLWVKILTSKGTPSDLKFEFVSPSRSADCTLWFDTLTRYLKDKTLPPPIFSEPESVPPMVAARADILARNPATAMLYSELVLGGIVSESDFWASRDAELAANLNRIEKQPTAVGALLPPTKPEENLGKQLLQDQPSGKGAAPVVLLDPESIHAIFLERPFVRRCHQLLVPAKMSSDTFWTCYCRSVEFLQRGRLLAPSQIDAYKAKLLAIPENAAAQTLFNSTLESCRNGEIPSSAASSSAPRAHAGNDLSRMLADLPDSEVESLRLQQGGDRSATLGSGPLPTAAKRAAATDTLEDEAAKRTRLLISRCNEHARLLIDSATPALALPSPPPISSAQASSTLSGAATATPLAPRRNARLPVPESSLPSAPRRDAEAAAMKEQFRSWSFGGAAAAPSRQPPPGLIPDAKLSKSIITSLTSRAVKQARTNTAIAQAAGGEQGERDPLQPHLRHAGRLRLKMQDADYTLELSRDQEADLRQNYLRVQELVRHYFASQHAALTHKEKSKHAQIQAALEKEAAHLREKRQRLCGDSGQMSVDNPALSATAVHNSYLWSLYLPLLNLTEKLL